MFPVSYFNQYHNYCVKYSLLKDCNPFLLTTINFAITQKATGCRSHHLTIQTLQMRIEFVGWCLSTNHGQANIYPI